MPTNNAAPIGTRAQQWYIEKMPGPDTAPIRTPSSRSPEFGVDLDIVYIAHCENAQIHNSHNTCQQRGTHWDPRLILVHYIISPPLPQPRHQWDPHAAMVIEIPPTDAAPNGTRAQQWRVAMGAAAGEPQTRLPEGTAFLAGCLLTTDAGPIGCRSFGTYMHGSQSVSHFTDIFKMSTTDTGPNGCRVVAGIIVDLPTTDAAPYGDRVFYKYMYYLPTTHTAPYGDRVFCRYAYFLQTRLPLGTASCHPLSTPPESPLTESEASEEDGAETPVRKLPQKAQPKAGRKTATSATSASKKKKGRK
ncbi:hypothetical protein P692DRAFT_201806855 [Suillus brevipes Sb2]|nr:hypothetical protein P692DRAFT_201806855 [Suillus brevipes Sb2]